MLPAGAPGSILVGKDPACPVAQPKKKKKDLPQFSEHSKKNKGAVTSGHLAHIHLMSPYFCDFLCELKFFCEATSVFDLFTQGELASFLSAHGNVLAVKVPSHVFPPILLRCN